MAVNPDGSPGPVAANELIESSWGNAVATTMNTRRGVFLAQTGQQIASGATATMAWDIENLDTDGYHTAGSATVTIPPNRAGLYVISVTIGVPTAIAGSACDVTINGAQSAGGSIPIGTRRITTTWVQNMAVAASVSVSIYNGNNAALFFSGAFNMWRLLPS